MGKILTQLFALNPILPVTHLFNLSKLCITLHPLILHLQFFVSFFQMPIVTLHHCLPYFPQGRMVVLNGGNFAPLPPRRLFIPWTFLVVTVGGCYWHLMDGHKGKRAYETSYDIQDRPPQKRFIQSNMSIVPQLRNSGLQSPSRHPEPGKYETEKPPQRWLQTVLEAELLDCHVYTSITVSSLYGYSPSIISWLCRHKHIPLLRPLPYQCLCHWYTA